VKIKIRIVLSTAVLAALVWVGGLPRIARGDQSPRVIDVTAKRFEFVPSTLTLKKGETVKLRVTSEDVTHGLFLRVLHLDTDLVPGQPQEFTVTPEKTGTFTAICHHFCGAQHGNMKMTVVVE
jgi:cytochrome c oxidase subunit 2